MLIGRKLSRLKCLCSKGKAVPLQAWSGPEGFRKLRFPDFMTTAQVGGKVVSLTHWPPLYMYIFFFSRQRHRLVVRLSALRTGRLYIYTYIKVKQSLYRPGVAQKVPGSYGYQIS